MINKLKSFVDIDPALPGPPTEGSNGLKFVTSLKSDVSSKVGGSIDKFASKTQLSIGGSAGNFVGGAIGGVSNFSKDVLSGVDTGILGNAASKVYDIAGNVVSKVDSVTGGITSKVNSVTGGITSKVNSVTGGITSKVGMISDTITDKTGGLVNVSDYSPYHFNANNLKDKIEYIILNEFPKNLSNWERAFFINSVGVSDKLHKAINKSFFSKFGFKSSIVLNQFVFSNWE